MKKTPPPDLTVRLGDPGMTPLLRAGLGGLAASLRAVALADGHSWPLAGTVTVQLGAGCAVVDARGVTLRWNGKPPEQTLKRLFERSFRISPEKLIELPGTRDGAPTSAPLLSALQSGLKRTFLQHGRTTRKAGTRRFVGAEIDGRQMSFEIQPYKTFVHRETGAEQVAKAVRTGAVELAGWAYPGAAQRHVAFPGTKYEYGPAAALAACFALVGCLSLQGTRMGAGIVVVPEPDDLLRFAVTRPRLTPRRVADAYVAGTGDAVLSVHVALRLDEIARTSRGVAAVHGVLLRTTAWDTKQKYRVSTLSASGFPDDVLDLYYEIMQLLPTRIVLRGEDDGGEDARAFFVATSALRGFVADNLASGRRWFAGFATATTPDKKPRFIHYYRDRDNLGALFPQERKGLVVMLKYLEEAEGVLVRSVHVALHQRFGAIASETDNNQTRRNRMKSERERWRMAIAGAKTHEQVRAALADLWSRAGTNRELRANWGKVIPLLRAEHWQTARDLALVALASYQGAGAVGDGDEVPGTPEPAA